MTGLALGPYGLALVGREIGSLQLVNGTAVAVIAMTAGSELEIKRLRPLLRSTVWMVTLAVLVASVLIAAMAFASRYLFGFVADLSTIQAIAVCSTLGVVLAAQSPAVVVALRRETRACGPLPDTVRAVVVGDLLVIFLFSVAKGFGERRSSVVAARSSPPRRTSHLRDTVAVQRAHRGQGFQDHQIQSAVGNFRAHVAFQQKRDIIMRVLWKDNRIIRLSPTSVSGIRRKGSIRRAGQSSGRLATRDARG